MSAPKGTPKLSDDELKRRHAAREAKRRKQRVAQEGRRQKRRREDARAQHPVQPYQSPEEMRRRAWAAVAAAKRRVPPFTDPRWERSHEDAMAEEQAKRSRAA